VGAAEGAEQLLILIHMIYAAKALKAVLADIVLFCWYFSGIRLREYQQAVARSIVESVMQDRGDSFVVMFPRQSGKNELQAQIEAYLMLLFSGLDGELVKASPTWKPQSQNAMRRLERVLSRNRITQRLWGKEQGYIYRVGQARQYFLSGDPTSNVVGATATVLLQCDESQDMRIDKWDKDFAPMAASTNATRVFWGTAWTSRTLLARELRAARQAEAEDSRQRVFVITAEEVAREVPAYEKFVQGQIQKLGRNHPLVKTQFFSQEIDAQGGLFPPERRALMVGNHERAFEPLAGRNYALLVDVAGEDQAGSDQGLGGLANPNRDSTACTIVEVDLAKLEDELTRAPTYRVVNRRGWTGVKHANLYGEIKALAEHWGVPYLVIDATGVGAGLASFLEKALPGRVIPLVFNARSKSDLGWDFLSVVETGRFKDHSPNGPERVEFWRQLVFVEYQSNEHQTLRWGVPAGSRDPATGELVHDDWVLSAALCALLDKQTWGRAVSQVIAPDYPEEKR
jgi:hypothetical protein